MLKRTRFLFLIIISNVLYAQIQPENFPKTSDKHSIPAILKNDASKFFNTSVDFLQSPLHFDSDDFLLSGIIAGSTGLSFTMDNTVRNEVKKMHGAFLDNITPYGEKMGNPGYSAALSGILYFGGLLTDDKDLRETGQILFQALLFNGIVTQGLKMSFGRSRPYTNVGNMQMEFFEFEKDDAEHSLPSGHTSTAFTAATVLSQRFDNIYLSVALYSLAGLTAFQRMYSDVHWFSDTVLGAALGTVIGLKVVKLYEEQDQKKNHTHHINITPQVSSMGYGMNVSFVF